MENEQPQPNQEIKPKKVASTYEDFDTYYGNRNTALTNLLTRHCWLPTNNGED